MFVDANVISANMVDVDKKYYSQRMIHRFVTV